MVVSMNIMSRIKQRGEEYYEVMQKIYEEAIILHNEGLGGRRISRIIEEKYGIKLHWTTINEWLYKARHPLGSYKKFKICPELAYVITAWLGDGTLTLPCNTYGRKHNIELRVKDYEFAEEFGRCAGIVNNNPSPYKPVFIKSTGFYNVRFCNTQLYYLLKRSRENPWISMPYLKLYPAEACRGFFDAEGWPDFYGYYCYIAAGNDDLELLKMIAELLKYLDISSKIYMKKTSKKIMIINGIMTYRNRDKTFTLNIKRKKDTINFYEKVGFIIKRKQEKLKQALTILGWI